MARKRTKTSINNSLDKLWSEIIRSKGFCERCGKTENLQAAHIITRSNRMVRWDEFNGLCLCAGCHLFWAHKEPLEFSRFVEENYPGRVEYLLREKNKTIKRTIPDLLELEQSLKEQLK